MQSGPGRLMTVATALLLALAGCEQSAPPLSEPADVSRPTQILEVTASALGSDLRFPGRVRAVRRVELAFNVPGQTVELPITEGAAVKTGALLARFDPATDQTHRRCRCRRGRQTDRLGRGPGERPGQPPDH